MWLRVLGSAAGGGSPQWNCTCPVCTAVRAGDAPVRTQSSIAVSPDRERWFLINASPDVRTQIESFPPLRGTRGSAVDVLLTDAELDHTLGLLLLREAGAVRLRCTAAVRRILCEGSGVLRTLERFCVVDWIPVVPGESFVLTDGLTCTAFDVPTTKRERFGLDVGYGRVVGYRLTGGRGSAVYVPGAQTLPPGVVADASCVLLDGTCWSDDEVPGKSSHGMGHLPVSESLGRLGAARVVYVHVNNTNPILLDGTPERRAVEERGAEVAVDGLELEI